MEESLYLALGTWLWNCGLFSSGECLKTFQGHSRYVESVAFSPDGRTVVSGSRDKTWNCGLFLVESVSRLFRATATLYAVWLSVQMEGPLYLAPTTILWNCGLFPQESVSRLSMATATMYLVWHSVQMEGLLYLTLATWLWNCGLFPQESVSRLSTKTL